MNEVLQAKLKDYTSKLGKGGQAQVAKAIGYTAAVISLYLKGEYSGNIQGIEDKLNEFFNNLEAAENLKSKSIGVDYVPTSISQSVYETIRLCHLKGGLAMEAGDAGIGKTMACRQYCRDYQNSAIYVTVNPCLATVSAFLKSLCRELKISTSGRKDDMWFDISDALRGDRKVIIVDEAQHLPIKTIETLRAFFDGNPEIGVCLVGNIETVTNTGKSKESFAQIRNRTKLTEIRHTYQISENDIKLLFPTLANSKKEIQFLLQIARSTQGIRGAMNIYSNALDNDNTSYDGLIAMAKYMKIKTV